MARLPTGSHSYVVFAGDGEGWEEVGHDEKLADLFAEVAEFEGAALGFGGCVEANEGAQAHAVHVSEVGEIEDDALVGWE